MQLLFECGRINNAVPHRQCLRVIFIEKRSLHLLKIIINVFNYRRERDRDSETERRLIECDLGNKTHINCLISSRALNAMIQTIN